MNVAALQVPESAVYRPSPQDACRDCPVRGNALCGAVTGEARDALAALGRRKRITEPASLSWEGETSPHVGIVRSGIVKLTVSRALGDEQIVGIARAGEFIGRPFGGTVPYGLGAAGTAEVCIFPRDAFDRLAGIHSAIGHELLTSTLAELDRTRRWLGMLGKKNAEQKLAAFLAEFGELRLHADAGLDPVVMELPFNRQQIADILGLTIETVSRQFTWLRRRKIIELPTSKCVVVIDRDALLALSGECNVSRH